MATVITLKNSQHLALPPEFAGDDVRFPEELVEYFLREFTKEGDTVFDPFAGFGTTLKVAEKLSRHGVGVEFLPERVKYIEGIMDGKGTIIKGSALELDRFNLPQVDFSLTSPPFMTRNDHEEYPFAGYQVTGQNYDDYLHDIREIYRQVAALLKPGGYAVIEVCNISKGGVVTTLAWDIARSVGEVLRFEKEYVISWLKDGPGDTYGFGYDHSYCLLFQKGCGF